MKYRSATIGVTKPAGELEADGYGVLGVLACELTKPEREHAAAHTLGQATAAVDELRLAAPARRCSIEPERLVGFELADELVETLVGGSHALSPAEAILRAVADAHDLAAFDASRRIID